MEGLLAFWAETGVANFTGGPTVNDGCGLFIVISSDN